MKILVSHFSLYKKNGWGRTFEEAKGLARLGHEVTLLCSARGVGRIYKTREVEGVKVLAFYDIIPERFLLYGYGIFSLFNKLIYSVFTHFDICLSNSHRDNAYYPCAINRFFHHSKLVIEWWDDFSVKGNSVKSPNIIKRFLRQIITFIQPSDEKREIDTKLFSDVVVVLSLMMARRAEKVGVSADKIKIVYGGCDVDHLQYMCQPANEIKQKNGIPVDCITFGLIGDGDQELKDLDIFFDAMIELKTKYKILFLNYGGAFKKAVIDKPELRDIIHECGWVDYHGDNSILSATDVFVLIKQNNVKNQSGWPNKFGDYLACGRAVLLNPYGDIIQFIQKWQPGFIEVDYTKDSIKKGIASICEGMVDLSQLAEKNREVALSNSWLQKAKELENVFIASMVP